MRITILTITFLTLLSVTLCDREQRDYELFQEPYQSAASYWLASAYGVPLNNNNLRLNYYDGGDLKFTDGKGCDYSYATDVNAVKKSFKVTDMTVMETIPGSGCTGILETMQIQLENLDDDNNGFIAGLKAFDETWLAKGVYNDQSKKIDMFLYQKIREGHYRLEGNEIQIGEYIQMMADKSVYQQSATLAPAVVQPQVQIDNGLTTPATD